MTEPPPTVSRITLDQALNLRLTGYAIALFYVAIGIVTAFGSGTHRITSARALILGMFGGIVVSVATVVIHELVHGLFIRLFGARPTYGVGRMGWVGFYAYVMAAGVSFTLTQMIVICLAPLVVISAVALMIASLVPGAAGFAALAFVVNFSGAAGDLWFVGRMWRFRRCRDLVFVDQADGVDICTPDPAAAPLAAALTAPGPRLLPALITRWLITASVILVGVMPVTVVLTLVNSGDVSIGPAQFAIATYTESPDGGVYLSLDLIAVLVVGFVFAAISLFFSRPKSSNGTPSQGSAPHPAFL